MVGASPKLQACGPCGRRTATEGSLDTAEKGIGAQKTT